MHIDFNAISQTALSLLTTVGFKVVGAIILWIIGRGLIRFAVSLVAKALDRQHLDSTIVSYIRSSLGVLLTLALVIALLGFFGVETTTFAALLAGAGLAIGAAWSGLLSNFAAGLFLVILRPFKVGDFVTAGGVTGTVTNIGIFGTTIDTPDNVQTIIGNGKIFSDTIQNFSANAYRRVDLLAQLSGSADHAQAIELLTAALKKIPNVCQTPAPEVSILTFTMAGPVLAVRPYTANANYWQVYFDANRAIKETLGAAGFPAPGELHYEVQLSRTAAA